jgi:uncharacterized protein (TIGR03084 family)
VDELVDALADQQAELGTLLRGLTESDWRLPTRCQGWDVADVVTHLSQTDAMAVDSAGGHFAPVTADPFTDTALSASIDVGAAHLVEDARGVPYDELFRRWSTGASRLVEILAAMDLSTRVTWVAGTLSARTLVTTRLAETWIHTGDVAAGLSVTLPDTDRLRPIARLAWRTLPYAFASAGRTMAGPVAFHLSSPDGGLWDFVPDHPAVTTISGSASELCTVAARRIDPSATGLWGEGPDVEAVLALLRTYAL